MACPICGANCVCKKRGPGGLCCSCHKHKARPILGGTLVREQLAALPDDDPHHQLPPPDMSRKDGPMGWSKYQRCPRDRHVMRRVKLGKKYQPHYYCPACTTVLALVKGELVLSPVAELVMQTGVDDTGHVRRHVQIGIFEMQAKPEE